MANKIQVKRSSTASAVPSSLEPGELAANVNVADGKLWLGLSDNTVKEIGTGSGIGNVVEDTTPQIGGNLALNEFSIEHVAAPSADHKASGNIILLTAGEALVFGQPCYIKSDGKAWKADADGTAPAERGVFIAIATIAAGAAGLFAMPNTILRDDSWAWTVGNPIYLSATAGALTQTAPSVARVMGIATHADRMLFLPSVQDAPNVSLWLNPTYKLAAYPPIFQTGSDSTATFVYTRASSADEIYFQFRIPDNFASVVSVKMWIYPDTTETLQWDRYLTVAGIGESATLADTALNETLSVTISEVIALDMTAGYVGQIVAGDMTNLVMASDDSYIQILGLEFIYQPSS